jgi:cephalosporin hydroxylase
MDDQTFKYFVTSKIQDFKSAHSVILEVVDCYREKVQLVINVLDALKDQTKVLIVVRAFRPILEVGERSELVMRYLN